MPDIKKK